MTRFCSLTLTMLGCALLLTARPALAQNDAGMKVYAAQKCSMCHSIADVGNKKLPLDKVGAKLSADQIREWIVTPAEALDNEKQGTTATRTWRFKAQNVRDFAWASSRKYIWDAMGYRQKDAARPFVMAMSFYPNEGEPIWSKYSTEAVVHTMEVYSRYSFPYPYPVAISVNSWERGGMEYPMISFNGYRPTEIGRAHV